MSVVSADMRKDFIISTAAQYFSLQLESAVSDALKNNICLNDFLEDSGCFILAARSSKDSLLHLENKLPAGEGKQTLLVFFKIRPEAVTGDNIHDTVFVASMLDSPVTSLYHTIQRIYAPILLKDDNWSHNVEPRLQTLVTDLEAGLRRVVLRAVPDNTPPSASLSEFMSVDDEIHYWSSVASLGKQKTDQQKGRAFVSALEPLGKSLRYMDSLNLVDADDIVETAHNCLDDLWKLDEYRYPQERMEHLMEITGKILTRFIQTKLKTEDIWNGPYHKIEGLLNQGLSAAQKYVQICQKLTSLFWPNHSLHRWSGIPYIPQYINKFALRLAEVLKLRTVDRQITRLLTQVEQEQFDTAHNFKCFTGTNTIQYNPYTDPAWQAAVKQFEQKIKPAEERVATKLKQQFRNLNTNTLQLMHEFKRYQELIQRPVVQTALLPERESLLGLLQDYIGSITIDPNTSSLKLVDMPPVVCRIYWVRQMEAKVIDIEKTSALLLNSLGTYPALQRALMNVRKDLKDYHTEQFDTWTRQTLSAINYKTLGLKTDEPVVYFEQGKLMHVNYNPQLVGLVKEVRQISVMGYTVPHQILEAAELAKRFIKQARALQQVATFHNTIGDRMIASQRPMMLSAAVELARLVREQHSVTWSNNSAVDSYITRLQAAVERLFRENNQLAHCHVQITDKVVALMSTDLLRHQQQWKEGLREIRDIMTKVEEQFTNMKSWRAHWEHQLYKALEHQYQLGLEALNQHMPEIKVDLVYRQQKLQFSPPMEEIRMKYYGQLKRFMAIPLNFRGVSDICIFPSIVDHNAHRFGRVFARAEQLFEQLEKVCDEWRDWVALGSCDLEHLARQQLHVAEDWENNFRASKTWGQEIAKLITTERKLDCFTISVMPVLAEIEQHNRRYWDTLTSSLYSSVLDDIATVDKFITDSKKTLQVQPQCLEEIGEANKQYVLITGKSSEIQTILERAQKKNRTLATWTKERVDQLSQLIGSWDNFQTLLHNQQYLINKQVETMKNNIVSNVEEVTAAIERFMLCWEQMKPKEESLGSVDILHSNLTFLKEKRQEWDQIMKTVNKVKEEHVQFDMEPPEFPQCNEMEADLKKQEETWVLLDDFNLGLEEMAKEEWIIFRAKGQQKMNKFIANWTDTLGKQPATSLTVRLLQELDQYKEMVPALKFIRGDMFSEKHWVEMFSILDAPYKPIESLVFGDFLKIRDSIRNKIDALQELNSRAAGEIVIRQTLAELDIWEVDAKFTVTPHTDSKGLTVNLIKYFNDIMNKVGDNQCLLQSIKSSPNYENFRDRASIWETRLTDLDSFLRSLNQIQRKWVYLEPIFGSGTLNIEKARFERVDRDLRLILGDLAKGDYRVITLCKLPHLRNTLQMLLQQLTHCQKSLLDFLEVKRLRFPRFYFLSDEDLLEILGQSNKENVIQSHLKKLFAGIHSVIFKDNMITAMQSLQGETVMLNSPVKVTNDVEEWLSNLSKEMKSTLKTLVITCLQSPDPVKFPSQVLCLAERVSFTSRCEQAIQSANLRELLSGLKSQLEMYTGYQLETSTADRTQEDKDTTVLELKLKALLVDTIYHISVVTQLLESNVSSVGDWHWQRRLRYYMTSSGAVVARMVDAEFSYSYEYQGNAPKLVHTPLTDKCYLTLTQAMSMGLGGNPYGPAGTGKTESVKALGGMLGRQVLVFNCDEGIDVQSLTRILVGLVKCGAWGCFDEFNRLEEATLSAISMQIHPIQEALRTSASKVKLLEQEVDVDPNTGIFVTLNPAGKGYAGRQKLPDNLKQLFRPVVMSKPDDTLIAEVILRCEGFKFASSIGHKLVTLFDMAKKLLSMQQHYDWGLRALKTVVGGCGSALRAARANSIPVDSEQDEMALAVHALRLNTLSKLTFNDCQNFDTLVQDMFPGVQFESSSHEKLAEAVRECYKDLGLIHNSRQEYKCVELYEQMQQRMGVVIFGPSGSGKSSITKLLKNAMTKLGLVVKQHIINAKAMLHTQLLGSIDMDTRQWVDGVLSLTAQTVYAESSGIESWIVFDSDVDPEWIESLNSVLDDNRLLTLPSGWRIQFGPNVHFLFETHDLSKASPATISRMGMILLSEEDVDQKVLVEAWIKSLPEETSVYLTQFIDDYFYKGVQWIMEQGKPALQHSLAAIVRSGLSHMSNVATKAHFAAAIMNGLGANLALSSRESFYKQVLEWTQEFVPDSNQILHSFYDAHRDCIDIHTSEALISNNNLVLTPRMKTARDVLIPWLESHQSFILLGPHGCGKSLLLEHCFSQLRGAQIATVHCSAQIIPQHILQKLSQVCMVVSSNYGRVYRPKSTDKLILYIKDINLVRPDKWGTAMLTAWIQQILTYGAFYDSDMEWTGLENIQLVFTITSGDTLSPRFVSINNIYCISPPAKQELKSVYTALLQEMIPNSSKQASVLAATMVNIYLEVKEAFTSVEQQHYIFTPRNITHWCHGLLRYPLTDNQCVLEALMYEGKRQFGDKLVSEKDKEKLGDIFDKVIDMEYSVKTATKILKDIYFVSESSQMTKDRGTPLLRVSQRDCMQLVEKAVTQLGVSNMVILPELVEAVARVERVLTSPGGSLILAGRSGMGRKTTVRIVSTRQAATYITPNITYAYTISSFKNDLKSGNLRVFIRLKDLSTKNIFYLNKILDQSEKSPIDYYLELISLTPDLVQIFKKCSTAMQTAGMEGEQVYFLLEDYQLLHPEFLDMINSLLSSGEVPGLYQPEELDANASALKELAANNNFEGNMIQYFTQRVQCNLHLILVLDCTDPKFKSYCTNNPALLNFCTTIWMSNLSDETMASVPRLVCQRQKKTELDKKVAELEEIFVAIHKSSSHCTEDPPRRYFSFVSTYMHIYNSHRDNITQTQIKLQAGVSKLTEARQVVDSLKLEAADQEKLLADKQEKATAALEMITQTMSNASIHRGDMDSLKVQTEKENEILVARKKEIEAELAEIEPLIREACAAVGNIKTESLSEIRSLRAPPEVIRDILEGVLRLMGIQDTSWNSMKTFLAKRGVKEDIRCFDARSITPESRESVERLLQERRESFNIKTAKRASQAAAPLASWVTANVKYSHVLEKIRPLEREQANLHRNLKLAEEKIEHLSTGLQDVDKTVAELKVKLNTFTKEAAEIEIHLNKAKETINSAETLVSKLDDEYSRWQQQLNELSSDLDMLPRNSLLAAAFVTYLSASSQDVRKAMIEQWSSLVSVKDFSLTSFLSTEREQLLWQTHGLPSDQLSTENAIIIIMLAQMEYGTSLRPLLLDPSMSASEWLKNHLSQQNVEVISQSSPRFHTTLDLAIRFGKTLIIQDVDSINPVLFPVLRGDTSQQDLRNSFHLYHVSRNTDAQIEPYAASVISKINFTTTQAGLTQQLIQCALKQEKPQLEVRRGELLRQEEELKLSLFELQENVLQQLAQAQGDILQNKDLLDSLNETKRSSEAISESLVESNRLKSELMAECNVYEPLAEYGSKLYFAIISLSHISNMYQMSVSAFLNLFKKTLAFHPQLSIPEKKQKLLELVYLYISRSVFKSDTLMLALHLAHTVSPHFFQPKEWELLTGQAVADIKVDSAQLSQLVPPWINSERAYNVFLLQNVLPELYNRLNLDNGNSWGQFPQTQPPCSLSGFQHVLLVQALRPDLLHSALTDFALQALGVKSLLPPPLRLSQLLGETTSREPILIVTSPGTDPSQELRTLSQTVHLIYHEVALGEGQETVALKLLSETAAEGHWLCLKNLHLMTSWLSILEKQLQMIEPHDNFRLWLTTEPHPKFSSVLASFCLRVTYEAPQGVKRNMMRTYSTWEQQHEVPRPLFVLAWFHAVVQERRKYIPQGWVKLYEFNDTDLAAALKVLNQRLEKDGRDIKWEVIQGLCESAIYGGRVDSIYDLQVLSAYLQLYFDSTVFKENQPLAPGIYVPVSSKFSDHIRVLEKFSDHDAPSFFGLPANIDRSWQRITSTEVITQLKALNWKTETSVTFDKQKWNSHLSPLLNLWKKLNQNTGYIKIKVQDEQQALNVEPIFAFFLKEFNVGILLIQHIHQDLANISRAIKGSSLPTTSLLSLANSLIEQKTPESWVKMWQGPSNPMQYIRSVVARTTALNKHKDRMKSPLDLSDTFHPEAFLSALRHQSAREHKVAVNELQLSCTWGTSKTSGSVSLEGLYLEGASFDGMSLIANTEDSSDVTTAPLLSVQWSPKEQTRASHTTVALPLYLSADRESIVAELNMPCNTNEHHKWILAGTAFYIRS